MCGIVGYIGSKPAVNVLIAGLTKLEYRGYDSSGVAVATEGGVQLRRKVGKLQNLEQLITETPLEGHAGIGHTRWATHGEPTEENCHPHRDATDTVYVAHNGIIENYAELRKQLENQGVQFRSATDTEVLPNLIKIAYDRTGDLRSAVTEALVQVKGSYAIGVLHKKHPNQLVVARKLSPLVIGVGKGENFFASDVPALLNATDKVIYLDDGEMAIIEKDCVIVFDSQGNSVPKTEVIVEWSPEQAEKQGYEHYMLKEIYEQPEVIERLISRYVNPERTTITLDQIGLSDAELQGVRRILIQACGTSWHAGLVGKLFLERLPLIAVDVDISSEFRYRNAILSPDTLVIAISQSGETADTLAGIREAKSRGLKVISIVNVPGSTIARESDGLIYSNAGPEMGVASTKAYTAQLTALYLLSLHLGRIHGEVDSERMQRRLAKLQEVPRLLRDILNNTSSIQKIAQSLKTVEHAFFIGRGFGYPTALEGALKLKEISYIHAEGLPAGELKHGPIALIDEKMPVIVVATAAATHEKIISNIQEIRARKGTIIAVASQGDTEIENYADQVLFVPDLTESYSPLLAVVPLQLLAYYTAVARDCDVDQPRNLAKSVTVE